MGDARYREHLFVECANPGCIGIATSGRMSWTYSTWRPYSHCAACGTPFAHAVGTMGHDLYISGKGGGPKGKGKKGGKGDAKGKGSIDDLSDKVAKGFASKQIEKNKK